MPPDRPFSVDYDHAANLHTVEGALETLRALFGANMPRSVLDVGCGTGTWLRAALDCGADEVLGVDGAELPAERLWVPPQLIRRVNLNNPVDFGRRFDLVLCLETAEHLEPESAVTIVDTITVHGDTILFSAAAPGQAGDHHVNCRWPSYWQRLFNERGYACDDSVRWKIWDNDRIEPWYRQNLMMAVRDDARAGREPRIKAVVHPELFPDAGSHLNENAAAIENGALPWRWYLSAPVKAAAAKLRRTLRRRSR